MKKFYNLGPWIQVFMTQISIRRFCYLLLGVLEMSFLKRKPVFGVSNLAIQTRLCSHRAKGYKILYKEIEIILSRQQKTKALIRLSAPLFFHRQKIRFSHVLLI